MFRFLTTKTAGVAVLLAAAGAAYAATCTRCYCIPVNGGQVCMCQVCQKDSADDK